MERRDGKRGTLGDFIDLDQVVEIDLVGELLDLDGDVFLAHWVKDVKV